MPLRAPLPGVDQHIQGSQHLDDALAAIGNSGAQARIVRLFSYLQWDKLTWTEHKVWQARFDWGHKPRPSDKGSTYGAHMEHIAHVILCLIFASVRRCKIDVLSSPVSIGHFMIRLDAWMEHINYQHDQLFAGLQLFPDLGRVLPVRLGSD